MCNCNQYRNGQLKPEFQQLLQSELYPEYEYENSFWDIVKRYTSGNNSSSANRPPSGSKNTSPAPAYPAGPKPQSETDIVKAAIAAGERNENVLTDKLFFWRHPELGGKPLYTGMPNYTPLSQEWLGIRNNIVRPALLQPVQPPVSITPGSGVPANSLLQKILKAMSRKGYTIFTQPYQLNIVGIRANNAQPNSFDDSINVFYKDASGNWIFRSNAATTDPGLYYLNNPMNVSGTAIVLPGQYPNSHKLGLHRSSYTALVQQGPMKIIRDTNKDGVLDFRNTNVVTGTYGLNIHRATSSGTSTKVDTYSAGCQVFANSTDFANFIAQAQKHSSLYGNNFTYTLMDEGDLY